MALGKSGRSGKSLDDTLKGSRKAPPAAETPRGSETPPEEDAPARPNYGKWIVIGFIAVALGITLLDFVDFDSTPTVEQRDLYARREDCEQDWGSGDDKCEPVRSGDNVGRFYGPHYIPRLGYGGIGGYPGTYGTGAPVPGSAPGSAPGTVPGTSGLAPQATGPARSLDEAMARGRVSSAGAPAGSSASAPASTGGAPIAGGSAGSPAGTAASSGLTAPRAGSHAMGSVHVSRGGFGSFGSHFSGGG